MFFYNKKGRRTLSGKIFFDSDGNLKAGTVGVSAVIAFILLIAMAVQIKKPAEQAVVKVTHLFKADPRVNNKQDGAEKQKSDQNIGKQPEKSEKQEETKKAQEVLPRGHEEEKELMAVKEEIRKMKEETAGIKAEAEETLEEARKIKDEAQKMKEYVRSKLARKDKKTEKLKNKLAMQGASLKQAERKNTTQQEKLAREEEKLPKAETKMHEPDKSVEVKEKADFTLKKSVEVKDETVKFSQTSNKVKEKTRKPGKSLTAITDARAFSSSDRRMDSIKLLPENYTKIYRARFASSKKKPALLYRWRISNQYRLKLKDCYSLFDMKAVAVTKNGQYYDLSDNTQITEDYLDRNYSSTVIICENPEFDFGDQIEKTGIRTEGLKVRYYMYNHTKNYFYNRVEQAVSCCQAAGKLPSGEEIKELIDVVGTVFKLKKTGGAFGVFVPTSVYYKKPGSGSAEEISVPAECFEEEMDVKLLKAKGLL